MTQLRSGIDFGRSIKVAAPEHEQPRDTAVAALVRELLNSRLPKAEEVTDFPAADVIMLPPPTPDLSRAVSIQDGFRLSAPAAQIIAAQIEGDREEVNRFINPQLTELTDIKALPNSTRFCQELLKATIREGRSVAIFHDYDVDGTTAAAILYRGIKDLKLHTKVGLFPSQRFSIGYSTNDQKIREAHKLGFRLIVMLDFGTNNEQQIKLAHDLGMKVLVIDHHHHHGLKDHPADVIINPAGTDSEFSKYCTAGLAYRVVLHYHDLIVKRELKLPRDKQSAMKKLKEISPDPYLILAAFGTKADVMPLTGDNRVLLKNGLKAFNSSRGFLAKAIREVSHRDIIVSEDIGFYIGPLINAAGRLLDEGAAKSVMLFIADRLHKSISLVEELRNLNLKRRLETARCFSLAEEEIQKMLAAGPLPSIIIVAHKEFHSGVVGIAAARIARTYNRPTVLLAQEDGILKGSARSIPDDGINLVEGLKAPEVARHVLSVGGHKKAAGLSLEANNLEAFKADAQKEFNRQIGGRDIRPKLTAALEITLKELRSSGIQLFYELAEHYEPTGEACPAPLFLIRGVTVTAVSPVNPNRPDSLRLMIRQAEDGKDALPALLWTNSRIKPEFGEQYDILARLELDKLRREFDSSRQLPLLAIEAIQHRQAP